MTQPIRLVTEEPERIAACKAGTVELLQAALADAQEGKFLGVAVVAQLLDSSVYATSSIAENKFVILGGLYRLAHRIQIKADEA